MFMIFSAKIQIKTIRKFHKLIISAMKNLNISYLKVSKSWWFLAQKFIYQSFEKFHKLIIFGAKIQTSVKFNLSKVKVVCSARKIEKMRQFFSDFQKL